MFVILCSLEGWDRIMVQGQSGQIVLQTPCPNNKSNMDWRCGLSGTVPALQAQSPEFNPFPTHTHTNHHITQIRKLVE
jgi:hypothetical protein